MGDQVNGRKVASYVEFRPAQMPTASPSLHDLQAEILALARAFELVDVQRTKLLSKSKSPPPGRLKPLVPLNQTQTKLKVSTNDCCDVFADRTLCHCGQEIRLANTRKHLEHDCALRLIRCLRPGCSKVFQASFRDLHELRDCSFTRHTRQLVRDRDNGDALVDCDLCHDTRFVIRKRDLSTHQLHQCTKRPIACRFAAYGCEMTFPQEEQQVHEANECVVCERRRTIAAKARVAKQDVVCEWCTQRVNKCQLRSHQHEECPERERPCPNAVNGCKEWIPVAKVDDHVHRECLVTLERNILAAKAHEKNAATSCPECGATVRLRYLDRHCRDECMSRIVPCKNAAHGCKARLRWRDRHLHEDLMSLSKDRSALEFPTGGSAYIVVNPSTSQAPSLDLPPPWTAEFYVWMVKAEEEVLSLHRTSFELMESLAITTQEKAQWQAKFDVYKTKLEELTQQTTRSEAHEETSDDAQEVMKALDEAEKGLSTTRRELALTRGWIEMNIMEAKRIMDNDVTDEEAKQVLQKAVVEQTTQILNERRVLVQLLPEADRIVCSDLEAWAKQLLSVSPGEENEAAEQKEVLNKRREFQVQLETLNSVNADKSRLQRKLERAIAKVDAKLAVVERCGRHIIASSTRNVISLVGGHQGEIVFYRLARATAERHVNFHVRLERNRWHHIVFSASANELNLVLNSEHQSVHHGVFDLPMSVIGSKDKTTSFQGYIHEIRYWNESRNVEQIQQNAASVLHVAKCTNLVGYWTFEEGLGDVVDDMSLHRPPCACMNTTWATLKRFNRPLTPSLRDETCCVVNQKLTLLAQRGRDRTLDVMVPCRQDCDQVVAFHQLERHHRLECKHRVIVCKEIGCNELIRLSAQSEHLRSSCKRHLYRNKLVERFHDNRKLVDCVLDCHKRVQRRFLVLHCRNECSNRLVSCPWPDCGVTILARRLRKHLEAGECTSRSKLKHEEMVDKARRRQETKETGHRG